MKVVNTAFKHLNTMTYDSIGHLVTNLVYKPDWSKRQIFLPFVTLTRVTFTDGLRGEEEVAWGELSAYVGHVYV